MKLLAPKDDVRTQKVMVAAQYASVALGCPPFTLGKDDTVASFCCKSPLCRVPVLETDDGANVFGSSAAARHIARCKPAAGLYGETLTEQGLVDSWMEFATNELEIPICCLTQGKVCDRARSDILCALKALNKHLCRTTYIVGEGVTLADISIAVVLAFGVKCGKLADAEFFQPLPCMTRWFETITKQEAFKKVIGEVKRTETKAAAPSTVAPSAGASTSASKNPLDDLPASSFDLNKWKGVYSNTKDLFGEAMTWFWANIDTAGWSFWYMKYDKLDGECEVPYIASNQLGGFMQRIDPSFRKYSFAVFNIVGEGKNFDIQGVWMVRGQELPFAIKDHVSFEYHLFRKLDPTNSEDKKLIVDYWCAEDKVEGRPIADAKVWK
eukprot:GHVT01065382.1.p1 GENE.GHVT01065382.1~~GHVT01065382.1.p1  ORF type:complete len:382 (+),score=70.76 GHVT01065382.1:3426-4571(+)